MLQPDLRGLWTGLLFWCGYFEKLATFCPRSTWYPPPACHPSPASSPGSFRRSPGPRGRHLRNLSFQPPCMVETFRHVFPRLVAPQPVVILLNRRCWSSGTLNVSKGKSFFLWHLLQQNDLCLLFHEILKLKQAASDSTSFKRKQNKDYTSQLLPFGAAVDAKVRDEETQRIKFDSWFISGIWPERQRVKNTTGTWCIHGDDSLREEPPRKLER